MLIVNKSTLKSTRISIVKGEKKKKEQTARGLSFSTKASAHNHNFVLVFNYRSGGGGSGSVATKARLRPVGQTLSLPGPTVPTSLPLSVLSAAR